MGVGFERVSRGLNQWIRRRGGFFSSFLFPFGFFFFGEDFGGVGIDGGAGNGCDSGGRGGRGGVG